MALEFRTVTLLKLYTGEDIYYEDKPFYKAVIEKARGLHIAGCTAYKCIEGYASELRGYDRRLLINFSDPSNLPVVLEFVDTREKIEELLPFLEKHTNRGLVSITDTTILVTDYIRERIKEREAGVATEAK